MNNSLGDYRIAHSSSTDINNIKWTQKNTVGTDKSKNKKKTARNTSPSNNIYTPETQKVKSPIEKLFKVEEVIDTEKSKNKKKITDKRFQTASASIYKIVPGFTRKAR